MPTVYITIIGWAIEFCMNNNKQFIRMDTWGDNLRLIEYYQNCSFLFWG